MYKAVYIERDEKNLREREFQLKKKLCIAVLLTINICDNLWENLY